jgi:hypothetical protein
MDLYDARKTGDLYDLYDARRCALKLQSAFSVSSYIAPELTAARKVCITRVTQEAFSTG